MTDLRDHPSGNQGLASQHLPAGETGGSHLAHWPPPQRGHEARPVLAKHQPVESAQHEKTRGWGLTRSVFKDDSDE